MFGVALVVGVVVVVVVVVVNVAVVAGAVVVVEFGQLAVAEAAVAAAQVKHLRHSNAACAPAFAIAIACVDVVAVVAVDGCVGDGGGGIATESIAASGGRVDVAVSALDELMVAVDAVGGGDELSSLVFVAVERCLYGERLVVVAEGVAYGLVSVGFVAEFAR